LIFVYWVGGLFSDIDFSTGADYACVSIGSII